MNSVQRVISPKQALEGMGIKYAIVNVVNDGVYDLYRDEDTAVRICNDLNRRYGKKEIDERTGEESRNDIYAVAKILIYDVDVLQFLHTT